MVRQDRSGAPSPHRKTPRSTTLDRLRDRQPGYLRLLCQRLLPYGATQDNQDPARTACHPFTPPLRARQCRLLEAAPP